MPSPSTPSRSSPIRSSSPLASRGPQTPPSSSFPLASHRNEDPWVHETTSPNITHRRRKSNRSNSLSPSKTVSDQAPTTPFVDILPSNHRLPPEDPVLETICDTSDSSSSNTATAINSREHSPSRFPLASPLARIATIKHARSHSLSSVMGLTAENPQRSVSPQRSGANLFATIFKNPEATPAGPVPEKKGLFGFGGFSSSTPSARRGRQNPPPTEIIDEFAGISFATLLKAYLEEPTSSEDALKSTPEGRLEDLVATATDLLDRVYAAYRSRTASLANAFSHLEIREEDMQSEKLRSENLRVQLDRLATEEREAREAMTRQMEEQQKQIRDLELELARERKRREAAEDDLHNTTPRLRTKRTSAGSDSGFESDIDSILSRSDARSSLVVSPTEGMADVDPDNRSVFSMSTVTTTGTNCEACRQRETATAHQGASAAAIGAETKVPTPLREAWSPENRTNTGGTGVWGFFKGRQQQKEQNWGDIDSVRMENRWLREKVREMERAVDGALEAVAGRGI